MTLTNETQEIDADALRARLAETPADLRGRIYTAAEAQALLDAREAKGAWRVGGVASEGKVWAHDPTALGGPSVGEVCLFNANLYRPHNGNRALAAAAPGLAAAVIAQSAEIERLRALLAVTQSSLEAASSGRRVTACDDIERLQRERDAALAVVAGLREEISDTADTLHRLSLAQQRLASQGSEEARAMGDAYLRAAQIVATIGDPARAATVTT